VGQVLAGVLVLVAFFALVTVAALRFASVNQVAHMHSEATASGNTLAEGGATFEAVNTPRLDAPTCVAGTSVGNVHFGTTGDVLQYRITNCSVNAGGGAGQSCALCLLDQSGTSPTFDVGNNAHITVTGTAAVSSDVAVNGGLSVANSGSLSVVPSPPWQIGVSGSCCGAGAVTPASTLITPVPDPLAGVPVPSVTALHLTHQSLPAGTATVSPGIYDNMTFSSGTITLSPGIYVITGNNGVKVSGSGTLQGSDVLLYMTCQSLGEPAPCSTGNTNAAPFNFAGNGSLALSGRGSGPWAGMAVFFDRNNTAGIGFNGGGGTAPTFTGTIYAPYSNLDIQGNGTVFNQARIVVDSIKIHIGSSGILDVTNAVVPITGCRSIESTITGDGGTDPGIEARNPRPSTFGHGHAVVQGNCRGGSGIVDFNYGP
jgi:hypothetical protein